MVFHSLKMPGLKSALGITRMTNIKGLVTAHEQLAVFEEEFNAETPRRRDAKVRTEGCNSLRLYVNFLPRSKGVNPNYRTRNVKTLSKRMECDYLKTRAAPGWINMRDRLKKD